MRGKYFQHITGVSLVFMMVFYACATIPPAPGKAIILGEPKNTMFVSSNE